MIRNCLVRCIIKGIVGFKGGGSRGQIVEESPYKLSRIAYLNPAFGSVQFPVSGLDFTQITLLHTEYLSAWSAPTLVPNFQNEEIPHVEAWVLTQPRKVNNERIVHFEYRQNDVTQSNTIRDINQLPSCYQDGAKQYEMLSTS